MRLFLVTSNKKSLYVLKAAYLNCGLYIVRYANITNKQPSMGVRNSVRGEEKRARVGQRVSGRQQP
jgi:hypothetical protein